MNKLLAALMAQLAFLHERAIAATFTGLCEKTFINFTGEEKQSLAAQLNIDWEQVLEINDSDEGAACDFGLFGGRHIFVPLENAERTLPSKIEFGL